MINERSYVCIQSSCDSTPYFSQVFFSVFGKEGGEGRFLGEGSGLEVVWLERINFPLVNRSVIGGRYYSLSLAHAESKFQKWNVKNEVYHSLVYVVRVPCCEGSARVVT